MIEKPLPYHHARGLSAEVIDRLGSELVCGRLTSGSTMPVSVLCRCYWFQKLVTICVLSSILVTGCPVMATNLYWDANGTTSGAGTAGVASGTWGVNTFWSTDTSGVLTPSILTTTVSDDLIFAAGSDATGSSTLTLSGGQQAKSLTFNTGTISMAGTASPVLTLGGGGVTLSNTLGGTLTFGATLSSVLLGADQTWSNNSTQQLIVNSAVGGTASSGATNTWTVGGAAGQITVAGTIGNGAGGGTLALNKTGTGTLLLSGSNTFTGVVTVNAGKVSAIGVSDSVGSGLGLGSQVLLGTGATLDVQVASGSTNSTSRQLIGNGGFTLANTGNGNLIWNGNMTNTGTAATTVFFNNVVRGTNEFAGVIQNTNNGSTVNVNFQSTQIWKLTGSNTFTGVVTIGGGTVIADKLANQGTASSIGQGGIVRFGYFDNAPSTFEYVGNGGTSNMQVRLGASTGTINNDASFLHNGSGALVLSNGSFTLTGNGNPATAVTRNLIIGGNNTADNTIQGVIGNSNTNAAIQLVKSGTGKWILTGSNTYTGGTSFAAGTLGFANGAFGSSGTLSFVGGTVQYVSGNTQDISTRIYNSTSSIGVDTGANSVVWTGSLDTSNVAGLTKVGAGMLTLSGSNGYTGTTTIAAGTLNLGSAGALAGGGSITFGGGTLQYTTNNTVDYASRIVSSASAIALDTNGQNVLYAGNLVGSNTGGLTKMGSGVLTLSGSNGYSGLTSINAGTVSLGSVNALGGGGSITFGGGTLQAGTANATYTNRVTGSGSMMGIDSNGTGITLSGSLDATNTGGLTKMGSGVLTLSGSNGYSGTTYINVGTLSLGSGNALGGGGSITFGGGTLQAGTANATYTNRVTGSGSMMGIDSNGASVTLSGPLDATNTGGLTKMGSGVLTLSGSNGYSGATYINVGTLSLGSPNALAGGGSIMFGGGTLQFTSSNTGDYSARMINNGSAIALDTNGQNVTYAGDLVGSNTGGLTKVGAGALTLSGSNGYTGTTLINAGTISLGSTTALAGGGNITFGGGTLQFTSSNTADYASRIVNSGSAIALDTNGLNVTYSGDLVGSNTGGLTKVGAGNLTLSGSNTFTGGVTVNAGKLIAMGVSDSAGSGLGLGSQVLLGTGATLDVQVAAGSTNSTSRQLIGNGGFTLANSGSGNLIWNGNMTNTGTAATTVFFNNLVGGTNEFVGVIQNTNNGSTVNLTFQNTQIWKLTGSNTFTGVVTIGGGTVIADKLADQGTASSIGKGGIVRFGYFDNAPSTFEYVGSGATSNMQVRLGASSGTINNDASFLNNGSGALVLTNGSFTLTGNANPASAFTRNLIIGGNNTADNTIQGIIANGTSNATIQLVKSGTGKWILTGSNTYTGGTTFASGTLGFANNAFGSSGTLSFVGGTVQYVSGNTQDISTRIHNSTSKIGVDTGANSVVWNGSLDSSNVAGLTKVGAGMLTLSGSNGYNGTTYINMGTLSLGSANALGGGGSITFGGGTLQYTSGNTEDYASRIVNSASAIALDTNEQSVLYAGNLVGSNTGGLTKMGSGVLTLSGSNGYSGLTSINAGTVSLGSANALGGGGSITFGGGTLQHTTSNTVDYASRIVNSGSAIGVDTNGHNVSYAGDLVGSNTGGLTKVGAGALTLSGSNGYTGTTLINAGTVSLGSANALAGGGSITFGGGTLQYTSSNTADYASRIANSGSAIALDTNGQNVSYAGDLVGSNTGGLTKVGAGALTLSGSNGYTGTTLINRGTLSLGSANALAGGGSITFGGGTLQYTSSNTADYASRIANSGAAIALDTNGQNVSYAGDLVGSNTGGLTKLGSGVLTLSGCNGYSGTSTLGGGIVQMDSSLALGTGTIAFAGGTLRFGSGVATDLSARISTIGAGITATIDTGANAVTFNSGLIGAGSLTKTGLGILRLEGSGLLSGSVGVTSGTLAAGVNGAFGATASLWQSGGALDVSAAGATASSLNVTAGTLTLGTSAGLVLSDAATLTAGSLSVSGSVDAANVGRYSLLQATGGVTGTLTTLSLPDSVNYYVNIGSGEIALQHRATLGTVSVVAGTSSIITGGSAALNLTVSSSAPTNSDSLAFDVAGLTNVTGSSSGSGVLAGGTSASIGGLSFTGTTVGAAQTGSLQVTGVNTSNASVTQSVAINVFDHASAVSSGTSIALADAIVGYAGSLTGAGSAVISNASGYRVDLKTTGTTASGLLKVNNVAGVASGSSASISARLANGQGVGTIASSFNLTYADDSVLSGASSSLGTVNINVTGNIYDHASTTFAGGTLSVGNMRTGYSAIAAGSNSLSVSNAAGFRTALKGSSTSAGGISLTSFNGLAAGGTATIGVSLASGATAGLLDQSFVYTFGDDSLLNGALVNVGTALINVKGAVYRTAVGAIEKSSAAVADGGTVSLGAVRVGSALTTTLDVRNGVTNSDAFSEKLNASVLSGSGTGTVTLLDAGSLQSNALTVGFSAGVNTSAGVKTGSVVVGFETDGTGTSGLAAVSAGSATLGITGTVYRLAVGSVGSGTVSLGAIREGGTFGAQSVTILNNAVADGFSDSLVGSGTGMSSGITTSGTSGVISAGSQSSGVTVNYTGNTAVAGAVSGTAAIVYTSKGQAGTGLADATPVQPSDTLSISGAIYRLAQGALSNGTLNLGNVRTGSVLGSGTVQVSNTASNDGYSDLLRVAQTGSGTGFTIVGGTQTLGGGQSGAFQIGFSTTSGNAGIQSGTVSFGLTSVGQSGTGLADVTLAQQNVNVMGTVYRAGSGLLASNQVNLGNIREGGSFGVGALVLSNAATADGFSEKLNVSFGTLSGSSVVTSGSLSQLAAGTTNALAMTVGLSNTGSAGLKSGSVNLVYETDGTGTSGLAAEVVGGTAVNVAGKVYRKAEGSVGAALDFGAIREGGIFTNKAVVVSNMASNDGYSDDLLAVIASVSAGITNSGSVGGISAGSQSSGLQVSYNGNTTEAGVVSGTATVTYTSKGQAGTGLADVTPDRPSDAVALSGKIYRLAQGTVNSGTVNLGRIHMGNTFSAASVQISNSAANDGYSDLLRVDPASDPNNLILGGTSQTVASADTASFAVGYNVFPGTLGYIGGTLTFGMTSVGRFGTGLADISLGSQTVNVTGQVYSGQGVWVGGSTGTWSDFNNWSADGGRPGLDGVLSRGVDSAVFNSPNSALVQMPSQLVELHRLELLGNGGIRLSRAIGGGGTISLSGASASVHAAGGNHFVEVPLTLASAVSVTVDQGSKLTLGGILSGGGGLTKLGDGTLVLSSVNLYLGQTVVSAGRLELGVGALLGPGAINLSAGTQLAFHLTADLTISNTIVGLGRVVSLNSPYRVFWNGGSTDPSVGSLQIAPGTTLDFTADMLSGDGVLTNNSGTLKVSVTAPQIVPNNVVVSGSADFAVVSSGSLVFGGTVSGDGTLRKKDTGTLVLLGSNTYFGGTEVVGGTLVVKGATSLGGAGVKIDAPGQLLVNVDPQTSISVANTVSGEGELLKAGAGTLTLTGANTHQIGTRVKEGALAVSDTLSLGARLTIDGGSVMLSGTTAITQPVNFATTSHVFVQPSGRAAFTGALSGAGDLIKDGLGSLLLSGSGALTGRAILAQGTLKVTNLDTLSKVPVLVVGNAGADQVTTVLDVSGLAGGLQLGANQTLKGRGILIGDVYLKGATLAPGNSIDVERLQGNLALSNATYAVEYSLLNGGKSDRFAVTAGGGLAGTVTINGAVVVPKAMDRLTDFAPHLFTILTAEGGIDGRFAGIAQSALIHSHWV